MFLYNSRMKATQVVLYILIQDQSLTLASALEHTKNEKPK